MSPKRIMQCSQVWDFYEGMFSLMRSLRILFHFRQTCMNFCNYWCYISEHHHLNIWNLKLTKINTLVINTFNWRGTLLQNPKHFEHFWGLHLFCINASLFSFEFFQWVSTLFNKYLNRLSKLFSRKSGAQIKVQWSLTSISNHRQLKCINFSREKSGMRAQVSN